MPAPANDNQPYGGMTAPVARGLDKDRMWMLPRNLAADTAHEALFPIQSKTPEEQLMGVAVLFAALCQRCGVEPDVMHSVGLKVLRAQDYHKHANASLEALRDFAGLRIMGEEVTIS